MAYILAPPAFADEAGCVDWLSTLPLTNISLAQESLESQLKRLSGAELDPMQRVRIAERLRDTVMFLHGELAKRFADRPLPLNEPELHAWNQVLRLWMALSHPAKERASGRTIERLAGKDQRDVLPRLRKPDELRSRLWR